MKNHNLKSSWLAFRPIAHRGLHDDMFPENSIPAFMAAVKYNYPVELDVQLSYDGVLLVFHDYNTKRMTGISKKVSEIRSSDLAMYKLGGTDYCIPTFEQVLKAINGIVPMLIEIKNEGKPGSLEEKLCRRLKKYEGEFAVQSFNPLSVMAVKKLCPDFIVGQLSKSYKNSPKNFAYLLSRPDFISYSIEDMPTILHRKNNFMNQLVCCWTISSEDDRCKAVRYCSNYIFESIRP